MVFKSIILKRPDTVNNQCSLCDPSCSKCSLGDAESCTSCPDDTFLEIGIDNVETFKSKCVNKCLDGYYLNLENYYPGCYKCSEQCKTCDNL